MPLHRFGPTSVAPYDAVHKECARIDPWAFNHRKQLCKLLLTDIRAATAQVVGEPENGGDKLIDFKKLEEAVDKIASALPQGTQEIRAEVRDNIRLALESAFSRMNLVTREEFDAQSAVLQRTREKLDQLEAQIAQMEAE